MSTFFLSFFAGLLILQYSALVVLLKFNWKNHSQKSNQTPKVSVLIAARNEETNLPSLLKSLEELDYPQDKLQILIADDQSEDATHELAANWVGEAANRFLITIRSDQTELYQKNGKANALAILDKEATGDYFFFTDADCEVPKTWIRQGVSCFGEKVGLVLGITQVRSKSFFENMQELDWWNTLGIVKMVTDCGMATTGLGNNMVISREAYFKGGGFAGIPFSLTEDLEISRAVAKAGFTIRHQVSEDFLVRTKAEKDWHSLLRQRKRWMAGAMTLSIPWNILLGLQFLFFPTVLALIALDWKSGLFLCGAKIFVQGLFLSFFAGKSSRKISVFHLIVFDFYQIQSLSLTILYYFWPGQTQWKSRNYP